MTTTLSYADQAAAAAAPLGDYAYVVVDQWDDHDPWGSVMMAAFLINDALHVCGGETDPTYRPGLNPRDNVTDTFGGPDLLDAIKRGELSTDAFEETRERLADVIDTVRAAGRDY